MKTIYLTLLVFLITASRLYTQVSQQWEHIYDNNNLHDNLEKTIVDNQGSVFLIGQKSMYSGSYMPQPFVTKVSTGGVLQYTRTFTHPYVEHPNARGIYLTGGAPDNLGNILVTGFIDSGAGYRKAVLIKYNNVGDTMWARYMGIGDTMRYCEWHDVKIDNGGNIFVTGSNYNFSGPSFRAYITAKYNSSGVLQWCRRYTPSVAYSTSGYKCFLELDNSGNIIAASTFERTSSSSSLDMQAMKFSSAGNLIWATAYNGPADGVDWTQGMKLDAAGNVYLIGRSTTINANAELGCIRFNAGTGAVDWTYKLDGTSTGGFDDAYAIDITSAGDIYISGVLYNNSTFEDGVLVKLNTSGAEQWKKIEATGFETKFMDVKSDPTGVYVAIRSNSGPNYIAGIRKYNAGGDTLWNSNYHVNTRAEMAKFINLGPSNNIYISGYENFANNTGYVFVVRYTHFLSGVSNISNEIPSGFSLKQNYPNPFNPVTNINFNIPKSGFVKLTVFDITGKEIAKLVNSQLAAGTYNADFNASSLSSGVYFYKLETEGFTDIKKMILVK